MTNKEALQILKNARESNPDRYDVDAWMPLPEQYKTGQKNE